MLSPQPELDHEEGSAERERSGRLSGPHVRPQLQTANTAAHHTTRHAGGSIPPAPRHRAANRAVAPDRAARWIRATRRQRAASHARSFEPYGRFVDPAHHAGLWRCAEVAGEHLEQLGRSLADYTAVIGGGARD